MTTLYRKYRPQNFKEVVSQNHIRITLEHQIQSDNAAHAYLFCGPRAVGKTTLARVLAKALNCTKRKSGQSEPCNKCETCSSINSGRSLDIIEIDAASHTGVDNVRENVIASARVAPSICKFKVFIIDEVHMLSISAFNALLKILEEPPEYVIFILCTTEVHKVPTTIISRCQRFDFKRFGVSSIVKKLQYIANQEGIKVDKQILEAVARNSEGHMRDAESLLGQVIAIGGREITREEADLVIPRSDISAAIDLLDCLAKKDAARGIQLINKLLDEGINLKQFSSDIIEILRKIMLTKLNYVLAEKFGLEWGEQFEIKINEVSKSLNLAQLTHAIERFMEARNNLKSSFITQLPLELAIIEICTSPTPPRANVGASIKSATAAIRPASRMTTKPAEDALPASKNKAGAKEVKIDHILARWHEVLAKTKSYNHSLSFILRVCQPQNLDGNQLCLAFKYKFHKDRVGDRQIKTLIEKVLHEVYGTPLTIEAVIDENIEVYNGNGNGNGAEQASSGETPESGKKDSGDKKNGDMINNLLKTFGGKVIK